MSVHQLTLGHTDIAWVLHKTRNIGKDFMEHKNSIKQKILVVEAFCRTVDVHSQKPWMMQFLVCKGLHLYHLKEILARRWRNDKSQGRNEDLDEEMKYSSGEMKTSYTTNRENDNSRSNSSRNDFTLLNMEKMIFIKLEMVISLTLIQVTLHSSTLEEY